MTEESAFEADPLHFALAVLRLVVAEELVVREAVYGQSLAGLNSLPHRSPLACPLGLPRGSLTESVGRRTSGSGARLPPM